MHASLALLAKLPGKTEVYPGHEYTVSNLRFAAHLEPHNCDIQSAVERAARLLAEGKPTVGTTIDHELRVNPFLRVESGELRATLGVSQEAEDVDAFAAARAAKDSYR
jgi:hydroxyacylglutathione hydrolase